MWGVGYLYDGVLMSEGGRARVCHAIHTTIPPLPPSIHLPAFQNKFVKAPGTKKNRHRNRGKRVDR